MKVAFQMDPLERLNKAGDSTLNLARAAAGRGHELFHYEVTQLRMDIEPKGVRITARGHTLALKDNDWVLGEAVTRDLSEFDVILMRQDPPFDLSYITATHILEHLKGKVRVINDPEGVRNAPEKLLVTHVPHLMPPTLIARDKCAIEEFRKAHGDIILKPLHGYAGHGVFHLRPDDNNLGTLVELLSEANNEPWMIQKLLPVEKFGDKRIIILNGEPVGVFTRMPDKGETRGNMRVGGKPQPSPLTKRDQEICETIAPFLRKRGLFLAGIDVIGDYLTEINVTSPTGLVVADKFANRTGKETIAEKFWDLVN